MTPSHRPLSVDALVEKLWLPSSTVCTSVSELSVVWSIINPFLKITKTQIAHKQAKFLASLASVVRAVQRAARAWRRNQNHKGSAFVPLELRIDHAAHLGS